MRGYVQPEHMFYDVKTNIIIVVVVVFVATLQCPIPIRRAHCLVESAIQGVENIATGLVHSFRVWYRRSVATSRELLTCNSTIVSRGHNTGTCFGNRHRDNGFEQEKRPTNQGVERFRTRVRCTQLGILRIAEYVEH